MYVFFLFFYQHSNNIFYRFQNRIGFCRRSITYLRHGHQQTQGERHDGRFSTIRLHVLTKVIQLGYFHFSEPGIFWVPCVHFAVRLCLTELCVEYIFSNMFTGTTFFFSLIHPLTHMHVGVEVENFSYVFQTSGSGTRSISRERMQTAQFSNPKTTYLEWSQLEVFFFFSKPS